MHLLQNPPLFHLPTANSISRTPLFLLSFGKAMVVSANQVDQISLLRTPKPDAYFSGIPVINLAETGSADAIVKACQEFGFFKVINHGIPIDIMAKLEEEAVKFFSLPQVEKEKSGPPNPFGYGDKSIGPNGDVGWVEYLLFAVTSKPFSYTSMPFLQEPSASSFRSALNEYISSVRKLASEVLELMAEGLKIESRNVFSKLVMDEKSDEIFRLNHYPPCPLLQGLNDSLTGFGEHTDPQIISVLRSNDAQGLEIALRDGSWVSVPSDQESFFINIGDSLQAISHSISALIFSFA